MQNQTAEQIVKTLKDANNVLVTVKNSPSVDELTAAIGLTLILNRMDKHAITVFSGRVPSTLEFLQPEMAIDTSTDSLRDFIIALDKSKADKLRYKVEDNVVRIFITPYKSSITQHDLEFSQGDFNVDAVVALGVVTKDDFDQAVTAHGRILHDATVIALTKHDVVSQIGSINWQDQQASSISEMVTSIAEQLGPDVLDGQIATSLLTGIVSETDRFKNANTTPQVLALSSRLMTAGANQQLIAEKLDAPDMSSVGQPLTGSPQGVQADDGSLEIDHAGDEVQKIHIDDSGELKLPAQPAPESQQEQQRVQDDQNNNDELEELAQTDNSHAYIQTEHPPKLFAQDDSGTETAQPLFEDVTTNASESQNKPSGGSEDSETPHEQPAHKKKVIEPLGPDSSEESAPVVAEPEPEPSAMLPPNPVLDTTSNEQPTTIHPETTSSAPETVPIPTVPVVEEDKAEVDTTQTLSDIEKAVDSPHVASESTTVDDFLGSSRTAPPSPTVPAQEPPKEVETTKPVVEEKPEEPVQIEIPATPAAPAPEVVDPTAPPAVPPPLMPQASAQPQFFDADGSNNNPFLNPSA